MEITRQYIPETMNIELTTNCPLRCPQCYCTLTGGKNIALDTAIYWIKEAAKNGVKEIMLSGGETMCYPHLYEVIAEINKCNCHANIALSGYRFTQDVLDKLITSGVYGIYISLNGSTEQINMVTRDGYELALSALDLLCKNQYPHTVINWVMHSSNADDFPNIVAIAERYNVESVVVLGVKPDSKKCLNTMPTYEQMQQVSSIVKHHKGSVKLYIESCFSPLLAMTCDTALFGNFNVGKNNGCGAGRTTVSVSVDGRLSPCRHIDIYEEYPTLAQYWNESPIMKRLREIDENMPEDPCDQCKYVKYCRPCTAIMHKLDGRLYRGNKYCQIAMRE